MRSTVEVRAKIEVDESLALEVQYFLSLMAYPVWRGSVV
jgi:hypothetical protein